MTDTTDSTPPPRPLALADEHRRLGGHMEEEAGAAVVRSYGDPAGEAEALRGEAAVADRGFRDRLELAGEDRKRFLGGLVTCDVKTLEAGQGGYGFVTDIKGKILADFVVLALEDRLWLDLPPGRGTTIAAHLGKYKIADRVDIRVLEGVEVLTAAGPEAEEKLAALLPGALPAAAFAHRSATLFDVEVRVVREAFLGVPAFSLWVPTAEAAVLFDALVEKAAFRPAGLDALERTRIEAGLPAFGRDFGTEHFPQESGYEDQAVSYTKGCYLGQEVIARIHYRGKANRAARRLVFSAPEPPAPGTALLKEGEGEVGRVGSAAPGTGDRPAVGIAVLHRKGFEPGETLEVEGGGTATVKELPSPGSVEGPG